MPVPLFHAARPDPSNGLKINPELVAHWLVKFLVAECQTRRGMSRVVLGLSGGVDSAVVAYLAVKAFGAANVRLLRLPYRLSSQESLDHAQLVSKDLGCPTETIDISKMVDGYCASQPEITPARIGNVCARCRMTILFDQSARLGCLPLGTGNKTERLMGYFTWHGDDAPPINPLGDLYKTQVWELARHLGVPSAIVEKPPTADLIQGQTDEGDFGISYQRVDPILNYLLLGWSTEMIIRSGFTSEEVALVSQKLNSTHWKRRLPTVAMLSNTSIGDYYLRPVDY